MSQYIEFYVRKGETFVNILSYSRNNMIYRILSGEVPYEKVCKLSTEDLRAAIANANREAAGYNAMKERAQAHIAEIKQFNNTLKEKMEAIHNEENNIEELDGLIEECDTAARTLSVLFDIANMTDMNMKYGHVRGAQGVYAGIETGANITVDDLDSNEG